jgi:ribonuclease HI
MLELYTDGSAGPTNPGPGGWAVTTQTEMVLTGWSASTTNIRMEGIALLEAFGWLAGRPGTIHTDSRLWVDTIYQWAPLWSGRGWRKANGETPANLELVQNLFEASVRGVAQAVWVRGHNGNPGNRLADEWANKARKQRLGRARVY